MVRRFLIFAIVALTAFAVSGFSTGESQILPTGTTAGPGLATVSAATLAAEGVTLAFPTTDAAVSGAKAEAVAENSVIPNSTVREKVLANLTDTTVPGMTNRLVWVVSVMPPGGVWATGGGVPGITERQAGTYMVVFVDAMTGQFLYAASGGEVTSGSSGTSARHPLHMHGKGHNERAPRMHLH